MHTPRFTLRNPFTQGYSKSDELNQFVFFATAFLAMYTIYSLFHQNKLVQMQMLHTQMEIEKMKREGIPTTLA